MNGLERVQAVLRGEIPDRVPVIPQGFMFSAYDAGYEIGKINRNPRLMAECHRICQEKYGYDGCVIDVDDASLAEACGARVIYREDSVAVVDEAHPLLEDLREIEDLRLPDPQKDGRLPEWLETSERLMEMIGDHVFIMGRADQGPFSLLSLLRGTQEFMMDLLTEDEDVIIRALNWATEAHVRFAEAQLKIAHGSSMGDAYASPELISPEMYSRFALPCEKKTVEALQAMQKPYSIHICGDTTGIIRDMGTTGADILEIDWKISMEYARGAVPENTVLMGNINPSDPMCMGTPEQVEQKAEEIIQSTRGKGIILSSGCALGANTKPENIKALVNAAEKYGRCDILR